MVDTWVCTECGKDFGRVTEQTHTGNAMSRTCNIACHDCDKTLWIGQARAPGAREWGLYGTPEAIEKLTAFLTAHEGHRLEFGDSEEFTLFEDVEPDA